MQNDIKNVIEESVKYMEQTGNITNNITGSYEQGKSKYRFVFTIYKEKNND